MTRRLSVLAMPRTYGECESLGLGTAQRACPWTQCGYHTGQVPRTCTLEAARDGGMTQDEVADVLQLNRLQVKWIEQDALRKIRDGVPMQPRELRERGAA